MCPRFSAAVETTGTETLSQTRHRKHLKSFLAGVLGHCHFCSGVLGVPTNARLVLYHWKAHSGTVLKRGQWLAELVLTGGQLVQMVSA